MPAPARSAAPLAVVALACSAAPVAPPSTVQRDPAGPCAHAGLATEAARADRALVVVPYRQSARLYDLDAQGQAVPWLPDRTLAPDAEAVLSYPDPLRFAGAPKGFERLAQRSFTYDMALAVLWRLRQGDGAAAGRLVRTLAYLQRSDGAWGFSFNAESDGFYNAAYVRAGTVAWVVYAVARYRMQTGDAEVSDTLRKGVQWLLQRRDPATGLLQAGHGRWASADRFHPDDPAPFSATEHVVDAWFALRAAAVADPALAAGLKLDAAAAQVARALDKYLWIGASGRYAQGMPLGRHAAPRDNGSALDAAGTWSALFAIQHRARQRALRMLAWVDARHATTVAGWQGLRPYADEAPDTWFVEGSVARAMALHRLGHRTAAREAMQPFAALACQAGVPLPYAPLWQPDFPLAPAAAPTLWFLLAAHEIGGGEAFLWRERPADGLGVMEPPVEEEVRVRVWHELRP